MFSTNRPLRLDPSLWLGIIGIAVMITALSLYGFGLSIDTFNRFRGDAAEYFRLAAGFSSWSQALQYVGDRSLGFPLFLFGEIRLYQWLHGPLNMSRPEAFLEQVSAHLFRFHLIASLFFAWSLRNVKALGSSFKFVLPLLFLFIHPGLIFHTTVLLTDTFCADLLMVATAILLIWPRRWASVLAGAILGFAVLVRPSYQVPLFIAMVVWIGISAWKTRKAWLPLFLLAGYGAAILPVAMNGYSIYGQFSIQNPQFVSKAIAGSWIWGREAPRLYWSALAPAPDYMALVKDPYLLKNWGPACPTLEGGSAGSALGPLLKCFALNPFSGTVFLFKKAIALFDHYQIQAYASDQSPRWLRLISRPIGALAFAGWIACFALLFQLFRRNMAANEPVFYLCSVTCIYGLFQCIPHVEPRYGFGALPGAFLGLAWTVQRIRSVETPRLGKLAFTAMLLVAVSAFLIQTSAWDELDPYLTRIESRNSDK